MARFLVIRLSLFVPVLFSVLFVGFVLLQVVPVDPAAIRAGALATPDVVDRLREELGLNEPLYVQFLIYVERMFAGDLGRSIISNTDVASELLAAVGPTAELVLATMAWAVPMGVAVGTVAAVRRGQWIDRLAMVGSVFGVSVPVFFVGMLLMWVFGFWLGILPISGRDGPLWTVGGLLHLVIPAVTLGTSVLGPIARITRTAVLESLGADFVRTARAKGLPQRTIIIRHALRAALIPIVTLIGLQIGVLLGGAVVTETMFAWPGIGRLTVGAILSKDLPLAQGSIIFLSLIFIAVNLLVDVAYAALDPRVRHES
jgi:ABC-type dipeptide/oligopeptide/nickel transport system permease component